MTPTLQILNEDPGMRAAGFLDITLLDHIIIAGDKHFSFADEGLI